MPTSKLENSFPFYRILAFAVSSPPTSATPPMAPEPAAPPARPPERAQAAVQTVPSPEQRVPPREQNHSEDRATGQNEPVNLARVAWLLTVVGCLVAALILSLDGYLGYGAVTFAVALSAAINLT